MIGKRGKNASELFPANLLEAAAAPVNLSLPAASATAAMHLGSLEQESILRISISAENLSTNFGQISCPKQLFNNYIRIN
jgi:hypothetical protein